MTDHECNVKGIFIAVIYCFCNKEVRRSLISKFNRFQNRYSTVSYSRATDFSTLGTSISEVSLMILILILFYLLSYINFDLIKVLNCFRLEMTQSS